MAGLNRATILGRLGQDPDVRYTQAGGMVTTLSLATSLNWKDKQTGEPREKTEWHRCVCFDRTAEIAQQYLAKGRQVYVEGRLQTRKWQAQDGSDRYTTEIIVEQLQLLGERPQNGQAATAPTGQPAAAGQSAPNAQPPAGAPPARPAAPPPAARTNPQEPGPHNGYYPGAPMPGYPDPNDDIPF